MIKYNTVLMKKNVDKFKKKPLWDPFILNFKKYKKVY